MDTQLINQLKSNIQINKLLIQDIKNQIKKDQETLDFEESKQFVLLFEYFSFINSESDVQKCYDKFIELQSNENFDSEINECDFGFFEINFKMHHAVQTKYEKEHKELHYLDECLYEYFLEIQAEEDRDSWNSSNCEYDYEFDSYDFRRNWKTYGV